MGHEKMGIKDGFYFLFRCEWMRRVIYIIIISLQKFKKKRVHKMDEKCLKTVSKIVVSLS